MRGARAIGDIPADTRTGESTVILADTSAWVEYDRATGSAVDDRLAELIEQRRRTLAVDRAGDHGGGGRRT